MYAVRLLRVRLFTTSGRSEHEFMSQWDSSSDNSSSSGEGGGVGVAGAKMENDVGDEGGVRLCGIRPNKTSS